MNWARDFARSRRPRRPPRPDAVFMAPWDRPPEPAPPDVDGLVDAMADRFVGRPALTNEGMRRHEQHDPRDLGDGDLWREEERAKWLLVWLAPSDHRLPWIVERLKALGDEQRRRTGDDAKS